MGSKLVRKQRASIIKNQAVAKAIETLESRLLFANFSAGSAVVEQVGQNATATTSVPITLLEYLSSNSAGISVSLPSSGASVISDVGNSGATGFISLSADGSMLIVPGYGVAPGTAAAIAAATAAPRVADSVDFTGAVTQPVSSTTAFTATQIRGATSDGLGHYYGSGPINGITYLNPPSAIVETANTNTRQVAAINGNLYYTISSSTSGLSGLFEVGAGGYPTVAGTTSTQIISQGGTTGSPYGLAVSPDGKTIYLADSRSVASGGGVQKWTSTTGAAGTFTLAYTFGADGLGLTVGDQGLAVDFSGANPIIYTTTSESTAAAQNKFIKIVDTGATSTGTLLATATTGNVFRGVALAPKAVAPAITSLSPSAGSTSGGNSVTINGNGFTGATQVLFGSTTFTSGQFTVVSDSSITVTAPAGSAGNVSVTVTGANTLVSNAATYTYSASPIVSSLVPSQGPVGGTNTVTINGSNFTAGSTVKFGTTSATGVTFVSSSQLTAVAPAHAAGPVDVTVTSGAVTSATSASDTYNYFGTPAITSLSLATGLDGGGQTITITGNNFSSGSTVTFGSNAASLVTVVNSTTITAVTPANAAGSVTVTVNTVAGSATTSFSYVVTNIANAQAALQAASAAALAAGNANLAGVYVSFDSNPVVTEVLEQKGDNNVGPAGYTHSYTTTAFFVTDSTGSIEVFGPPAVNADASTGYGTSSTNTAVVGDSFSKLSGKLVPFQGIAELSFPTAVSTTNQILNNNVVVGTAGTGVPPVAPTDSTITALSVAPSSPNNASTAIATLPLNANVIHLSGVTISGISGTFGTAILTGTITDNSGHSMTVFYSINSNEASLRTDTGVKLGANPNDGTGGNATVGIGGTTIPVGQQVDLIGFLTDFQNTTTGTSLPEFNFLSILPNTAAPGVSSVTANAGPAAGGNTVTIRGSGFTSAGAGTTSVLFGTTSATSFTIVNDSTITAVAPAHSLGAVDVTVVNAFGTSPVTAADTYTYTAGPVVTGLTPGGGPTTGGTSVTITGTGFTGTTSVTFGGTAATSFTVTNSTQIVAVAPAHALGSVDVIVSVGSNASTVVAADKYVYAVPAAVTGLSPNSGLDSGGTTVTITGSGFTGVTGVTFGTVAATSFTFVNDTTVTAVSPGGALNSVVDVRVTNVIGTSPVVAADQFTYTAVTILAIETQAPTVPVTLESNPVITQILSVPGTFGSVTLTRYIFLVQDATGSIDVFSVLPAGSTYVPTVGDTVSLTGTYSPFNSIPELANITAISKTGTAAVPAPLVKTVPQVAATTLDVSTNGVGEYFVTLNNVTLSGVTPAATTFAGANLTLTATDTNGKTVTIYYNPTTYSSAYTNLNGITIPSSTTALNLSGIVQIASGVPELVLTNFVVAPTGPTWFTGTYSNYVPGTSITLTSGTITADPNTTSDGGNLAVTLSGTSGTVTTGLTAGTTVHIGTLSIGATETLTLANTSNGKVTLYTTGSGFNINSSSGRLQLATGTLDLVGGNEAAAFIYASTGFDKGLFDGVGIDDSLAAGDTSHLTSVGIRTISGDTIVKTTYFGDADLSLVVDSTDYSRIDSAYALTHGSTPVPTTGWYNGDFNYDGLINGSDYTLIDNAFNRQGSGSVTPTAVVAKPAAAVYTPSGSTSLFSDKKVEDSSLIDLVLSDLG